MEDEGIRDIRSCIRVPGIYIVPWYSVTSRQDRNWLWFRRPAKEVADFVGTWIHLFTHFDRLYEVRFLQKSAVFSQKNRRVTCICIIRMDFCEFLTSFVSFLPAKEVANFIGAWIHSFNRAFESSLRFCRSLRYSRKRITLRRLYRLLHSLSFASLSRVHDLSRNLQSRGRW